jgi:AcrR family transcriptional regulator
VHIFLNLVLNKNWTALRENILLVAGQHFSRFGFKKTTLTDIASALGKQKTALYYYFKNKEDIFSELIKIEAKEFYQKLAAILESDAPPKERLSYYIASRIRMMEEVANRYKVLKEELFQLLPQIEEVRAPYHKKEAELLGNFLAEGTSSGHFSVKNPEELAVTLVHMLKGLEIPMFVQDQLSHDQPRVEDFVQLIVKGISA